MPCTARHSARAFPPLRGGKAAAFLHAGPSDRNGVALGEAPVAEAAPGVGGQLVEVLQGEVAQAVRTGELPDLLHRVAACDEPVLVGNVGAEVAGGDEGGAYGLLWPPPPAAG